VRFGEQNPEKFDQEGRATMVSGLVSGIKLIFSNAVCLNLFNTLLQDVRINNDPGTGRPRSGSKTIDTGKL